MSFLGYKITQFLTNNLRLCKLFAVFWLFFMFFCGNCPFRCQRIVQKSKLAAGTALLTNAGKVAANTVGKIVNTANTFYGE